MAPYDSPLERCVGNNTSTAHISRETSQLQPIAFAWIFQILWCLWICQTAVIPSENSVMLMNFRNATWKEIEEMRRQMAAARGKSSIYPSSPLEIKIFHLLKGLEVPEIQSLATIWWPRRVRFFCSKLWAKRKFSMTLLSLRSDSHTTEALIELMLCLLVACSSFTIPDERYQSWKLVDKEIEKQTRRSIQVIH